VDTEENLKLQAVESILTRDVNIHPQINTIYNKTLPKLRKFWCGEFADITFTMEDTQYKTLACLWSEIS